MIIATQLATLLLWVILPPRNFKKHALVDAFLVFFFFFRKNYLLLSCATSVRPSVRLSSVEIFSFHGNSLSSKPIDLKIRLNVREGVVHVRTA